MAQKQKPHTRFHQQQRPWLAGVHRWLGPTLLLLEIQEAWAKIGRADFTFAGGTSVANGRAGGKSSKC